MKSRKRNTQQINYIYLFPIIFFIGVIPFIVRHKRIHLDMSIFDWFSNTKMFNDFFTYYKSIFILWTTIFIIIAFIYYLVSHRNHNFDKHKIYIPLGIYLFFLLTSWLFSDYLHIATVGYNERFEGGLILTSYLILFIYITQVVKTEQSVKYILNWFIAFIILMNLIGFLQYLNIDYLSSKFFKSLILGSSMAGANLTSSEDASRVYMTLYHPNYVGLYISMVLPFATTIFLCTKNILKKILWLGLSIIIFINLIGSQSRGGLVGITLAAIMALILLRKKIFRYWKVLIPTVLIMCGAFYFTNEGANHLYSKRIISTIKQSFGDRLDYPLDKILTKDKTTTIYYKDTVLHFTYKEPLNFETFKFDIDGTAVDYIIGEKTGTFSLDHPIYDNVSLKYVVYKNAGPHLNFQFPDSKEIWRISLGEDRVAYRNSYGKESILKETPSYGFEGKEKIGSYRGYIWSRSNPLVMKHLLLGSGPDTFIFEFPQDDFVGKYNAYGTTNIVVDKPHSIYYQYAINTGFISLVAMIIFWIIYIGSSIKLYINNSLDDYLSIVGVALLLGIIGFLGAGLFNDTNVNVSPIYWGMIGLGYSTNAIIKNELENKPL